VASGYFEKVPVKRKPDGEAKPAPKRKARAKAGARARH
jgi:hypothetical protein